MPDSLVPKAPAGRRRFGITVLCFALVNLAAWVSYHQYSISRLHLLHVVKIDGDGRRLPSLMSVPFSEACD